MRVESDQNGECFGIGEKLTLIVHPTPEFELDITRIYCTNLDPINLEVFNPKKDDYTYEWTNENDEVFS